MKHILSIALIVALLITFPTALCESDRLQIFFPDIYVDHLNLYISTLIDVALEGYPPESIEEVKAYLNLTFNEEVDGVVYFDNEEMVLESIIAYYSGEVDESKPADMIALCFPKGFTIEITAVLQYAMAVICNEADPETSAEDVAAWMQADRASGDTLDLHGAYLKIDENEDYIQYSLFPVPNK